MSFYGISKLKPMGVVPPKRPSLPHPLVGRSYYALTPNQKAVKRAVWLVRQGEWDEYEALIGGFNETQLDDLDYCLATLGALR